MVFIDDAMLTDLVLRLIRVFNKTLKSVLFGRRIAASGHCR